jgi:hypothetical protein
MSTKVNLLFAKWPSLKNPEIEKNAKVMTVIKISLKNQQREDKIKIKKFKR